MEPVVEPQYDRAPSPASPVPDVVIPAAEYQEANTAADCYAVVNKTPEREPEVAVVVLTENEKDNEDNYQVCESAIILSDENDDDDNHIYETVEFKAPENVEKSEGSQVTVIVIDDDSTSVKKKKKRDKERKPKKSKREIEIENPVSPHLTSETSGETKIETDVAINEDEEKPKAKKAKKKKEKKKEKEKEEVENVPLKKEILNIEEGKGKASPDLLDEAIVSQVVELPSFRGAKAAEVSKVTESLDNEISEEAEKEQELNPIENDALVNSDDELVDLFRMTSTRTGPNKTGNSGSQNAVPHMEEQERDTTPMDDRESNDGHSQYLEGSDGEELSDKQKDSHKKLTGKEIEELKKLEIIQSMKTASSSNYVILDDEEQSKIKSERLRHELKNVGDENNPSWPDQKRFGRAVVLEISEEDTLQSLNSSRSSSVINLGLVSEDETERNELDRDFAVREMQKEIGAKIKSLKDDGDNDVEYTAVHEAVVVESRSSGHSRTSDHENGSDPIVRSLPDPLIYTEDNKPLSSGQTAAAKLMTKIHVEVGGGAHEEGGSVKSPSPDSGIHELNESCSSPSLVTRLSPSGSSQDVLAVSVDDVEIHADTFYEKEETPTDVIEKVDLPKTHNLGRVLFSMSSYTDRKPSTEVEQSSSDLFRTESYSVLADKLQPILAARHQLKQGETKPARPATDYDQQRNSGGGTSGGIPTGSSSSKYANLDRPQQTAPGPSSVKEVKQRSDSGAKPISRAAEGRDVREQQAGFRSKIIEEFQAKKGLLILGRSHSNSLGRAGAGAGAMNDPPEDARFSSLDRHTRPGRRDESHYDNPRSLMLSVGVWGDQPRDQQLSPPQASKQSSSGQLPHYHHQLHQLQQLQQPKQIEIRYKNGNTAELMEDPRKFVIQGAKKSKGDFNSFEGMKEEKLEALPSRPKLRSYKTPSKMNQSVVEPVIIAKVCVLINCVISDPVLSF